MKSKKEEDDDDDEGASTLEAGWFVLKNSGSLYRIFTLLRKAFPVNNWKTTISGLVGATVILARLLGIEVPPAVSESVIVVSTFLVGKFAADAQGSAAKGKQEE